MDWIVTNEELEWLQYRHKKRIDDIECRVSGDGPWPCAELRAAMALRILRDYYRDQGSHDQRR